MFWRRGSTANVCRVSDEEEGRSHSSVLWHENVRHKDTRHHIPLRLAMVMSLVKVAQGDLTLLDGFMIIPIWSSKVLHQNLRLLNHAGGSFV